MNFTERYQKRHTDNLLLLSLYKSQKKSNMATGQWTQVEAFRSGSEEVNIGDPICLGYMYITCTQKNQTVITRVYKWTAVGKWSFGETSKKAEQNK